MSTNINTLVKITAVCVCRITEKKEVCICQDCHRTCRSEECYRRHKIRTESGSVPCKLVYKCPTCHKFVEHHEMKPEDHKCGHFTCKSCRQYVDPEHLCYARSYPPPPPLRKTEIDASSLRT